jgi:hypothetical protein
MLRTLMLIALISAAGSPGVTAESANRPVIILLKQNRDVHDQMRRLAARYPIKILYPCVALHGFLAEVPLETRRKLKKMRAVISIQANDGRFGQMCAGE